MEKAVGRIQVDIMRLMKMTMAVGAVLALPAFADSDWACYDRNDTQFTPCFYVGAGLGVSRFDPDVTDTGWDMTDRQDQAFVLYGGYHFTRQWFGEVAYADMGKAAVHAVNPFLPSGKVHYKAPSVMAGYYLNLPRLSGGRIEQLPVDIFVKFGLSAINTSVSPHSIPEDQNNNIQMAGGVGVEWRFAPHWKLRGVAESYDTDASMLTVSVAYIFGKGKEHVAPEEPIAEKAPLVPVKEAEPESELIVQTPAEPALTQEQCKVFDGTLEGIHFKAASAELTESDKAKLNKAVEVLKQFPSIKIEVHAYTDSQGAAEYNQTLSDNRAKSVMDYFIAEGINAARMTSKGFGENDPIADNATAEGRAKNRRVELVSHVEKCKKQ